MEKVRFLDDIDYNSDDFAKIFSLFFSNGIFNNELMVISNNDMTVSVKIGNAMINGHAYENIDVKVLEIDNADGVLNRIDNVVIRLDKPNNNLTVKIIQGDYSEEPIAPELERNSAIYDLKIAEISIPAGATTITQDLITDTRFDNSVCGNVISPIETPDTKDLFLQLQTQFKKDIDESNRNFITWFDSIKDILDGDVAGNLANKINENILKTYTVTLVVSNWVLNTTTSKYEYNVTNSNITKRHYIVIDDVGENKLGDDSEVDSYDGGFKIETEELPSGNVDISVVYQLTTPDPSVSTPAGGGNSEG